MSKRPRVVNGWMCYPENKYNYENWTTTGAVVWVRMTDVLIHRVGEFHDDVRTLSAHASKSEARAAASKWISTHSPEEVACLKALEM